MKTFKEQRDVIKIEVGKTYELNNGEVHKCESMYGNDPLRVNDLGYGPFVINNVLYHQDGRFGEGSYSDLDVKRCIDEPETPKLWRDMTPEGTWNQTYAEGMSLRDWFAGQVIASVKGWHPADKQGKSAAVIAYEIADAMIAARRGNEE